MVFSQILNPADSNPSRIIKADKDFSEKLDFKDNKFPVKVRDMRKIEKQDSNLLHHCNNFLLYL